MILSTMEKLIITSRKILHATWNSKGKKWEKQDISKVDKPLSFYFPLSLELGEGVTADDVLRLLEFYEPQVDSLFSGYLKNCKLRDFILELDKEPTIDLSDQLDCLEFYWNINMISIDDDEVDYTIMQFPSIRGVAIEEIEEFLDSKDIDMDDDIDDDVTDMFSFMLEEYRDMSFVPLKDFKGITLVLNDIAEYITPTDDTLAEIKPVLTGAIEWTFFNFVTCFLTELSIHGTPDEQALIIKSIEEEMVTETNTPNILEAKEFFEILDEN